MSRPNQKLLRETMLTIAALNFNAEALHRFRRAAFGLDAEDRIEVAERISAGFPQLRQRQRAAQASKQRSTRRRRLVPA
jgi:hypothetical protein